MLTCTDCMLFGYVCDNFINETETNGIPHACSLAMAALGWAGAAVTSAWGAAFCGV